VTDGGGLTPERRARVLIDAQLGAAGWQVCDSASAVREVRMKRGHGQVDYLLYVDRKIVGVAEAKPEGTALSGMEWKSAMYADGLSSAQELQSVVHQGRLPFVLEASGSETHLTNGYDPDPRAQRVFTFPQPATLARILPDAVAAPRPVSGPDGHRRRQDVYRGDRGLPAAQARRLHPDSVPGRPQGPERPGAGGV